MFEHFVQAQDRTYAHVLSELEAGRKHSHWMWFIFPQLTALGRSETAKRFGIADLGEARAYLAHPVLGPRLIECSEAVLRIKGRSAQDIFRSPDDIKLRSSMTLFGRASGGEGPFRAVLEQYYGAEEDPATLKLLAR